MSRRSRLLSERTTLPSSIRDDGGRTSTRRTVAVAVLIKAGIFIKLTFLPDGVAIALSVVWLLACTNAFNLIDVMDGLSAGTAMVASMALIAVAGWNGREGSATVLAALAGACLGFLRFNFQPAKIYMGDCGSLFVGLMLGATAARRFV